MNIPNDICKVCNKSLPKVKCSECRCKTQTTGYFCASCGYLVHDECLTMVDRRVICNNCIKSGLHLQGGYENRHYEYEINLDRGGR